MEVSIPVASHAEAMMLFGLRDRNLKLLREAFGVELTGRGTSLRVAGESGPVEKVTAILRRLAERIRQGDGLDPEALERLLRAQMAEAGAPPLDEDGRLPAPGGGPLGSAASRLEPPAEAEAAEQDRALAGIASSLEHEVLAATRRGALADVGLGAPSGAPPDRLGATSFDHGASVPLGELRGVARSPGQERYIRSLLANDLVFCIGPAGTGKTYLAVRLAINFLKLGAIKRLILCRPAVEAGEKLGFLPGDYQAKINPYLRPLYDALHDILDYDQVKRYIEREIIEVLPLAFMRGRTLSQSFIILDEGQNTSISQMKMFLTRMGMSSRIVVNGDITQLDLPTGITSGLVHAHSVLRNIPGVAWIELEKMDIVRHPLVRRIVEAYEGKDEDVAPSRRDAPRSRDRAD